MDYAHPICVKNVYRCNFNMYKVEIAIVTCSSSRDLYLDVVKKFSSVLRVHMLIY